MYKEICIQVAGLVTRLGGDVSNLYRSDDEELGGSNGGGIFSYIKMYIASLNQEFSDDLSQSEIQFMRKTLAMLGAIWLANKLTDKSDSDYLTE